MKIARIENLVVGSMVILFLVGIGACSDSSVSSECTLSSECPTYTTCQGGACAPLECASSADCPTTDVCVQNAEGLNVCTAIECISNEDCVEPWICISNLCVSTEIAPCSEDESACLFDMDCCSTKCDGETKICVPFTGCTGDSACAAGETCDLKTGECSPEATEGCTPENCPDGTCDSGTDTCVPNGNDPYICMLCETDEQCGDAGDCVGLGGLNSCLPTCVTNGDCESGYKCHNLQQAGFRCVPGTFTCSIDCIEGCPTGQTCDMDLGECVAQLGLCDSCEKDFLCGKGNRCVTTGPGSKECVPECEGSVCSQGGTCSDIDQVAVCLPSSTDCCFGSECSGSCGSEVCGEDTPYCLNQTNCVECLNSTNCGTGCVCDAQTHECNCPEDSCGNCVAPTPVCNPQTQECVECMSNDDCDVSGGEFCNPSTKTCTQDICSACVAPYPACADINGQFSCVQCTEDADCASEQCNETTYFCEGTSGVAPDTCKCQTDADCPTGTQFTLKCNTSQGLCYDIEGNCDGISACCDIDSGSECISIFDLLGGGAPLPGGLPGGASGFCSCNALGDLCAIPIPGLCDDVAPGECMPGLACDPIGALLGGLFGGGGGETPSSFCGPE